MSENKDNKLTLINEKTANDYLTHTAAIKYFTFWINYARINKVVKGSVDVPLS